MILLETGESGIVSHGERIMSVLGVAQLPMRTRLPQYTYADLLGLVAHGALEDAAVDAARPTA